MYQNEVPNDKNTFTYRELAASGSLPGSHLALAVGTLDLNDYVDIVTIGSDRISVFLSNFPRIHTENTIFQGNLGTMRSLNHNYFHAAITDIDQNGLQDIVAVYGLQNRITWIA